MKSADGRITMKRSEFISEHERLVRVLQNRQLGQLRDEAEDQSAELKKVKAHEESD